MPRPSPAWRPGRSAVAGFRCTTEFREEPNFFQSAADVSEVSHVIIGGGLNLDVRLASFARSFRPGSPSHVHLNSSSGAASFLPFVRAVVSGFLGQEGR